MAKKSSSRTRGATPTTSSAGLGKYNHLKNPYNITPFPAVSDHDRRLYKPDKTTRPPTNGPPIFARIAIKVVKVRQKRRAFHAKLDPLHSLKSHTRKVLGFNLSRRLEMCIKRKNRKEVLFAKRKAGKSGQKKPIRNFWSAIRC